MSIAATNSGPGLWRTVKALFISSRPISWINTAYPFAAAYLLVVRELDLLFFLGTFFFLVPYNLALYGINDVFDYESDLRNPRKGGAHGAVLERSLHRKTLLVSILFALPFVVVLVLLGNWASTLALALSLFFLIAYSAPPFRWKEVPFLDSFTSSMHFLTPAIFGFALAGGTLNLSMWAIFAAFFLWGVASHAFGAVQDILADREGGLSSIATVWGAAWTTRFAIVCYLAAGVLMLVTSWPGPLAALVVLPYVAAIWPYRSLPDQDAERATSGWRWFLWLNQIAGFWVTILLIWWWMLSSSSS